MRRLPVFFVFDCSESMVSENLGKIQQDDPKTARMMTFSRCQG